MEGNKTDRAAELLQENIQLHLQEEENTPEDSTHPPDPDPSPNPQVAVPGQETR